MPLLLVPRLRWLFVEPAQFWLCLIVLLFAATVVLLCPCIDPEPRVRWTGTGLQLFGLVTTIIGIRQTRRLFGHPDFFDLFSQWFSRWPRNRIVEARAAAGMAMSGSAALGQAQTRPGSNASLEERVQFLQGEVDRLSEQLVGIDRRLTAEAAARDSALLKERAAREAEDARLRKEHELSATGGLWLSAVGLTWLIVGTATAGFSVEIAALLD